MLILVAIPLAWLGAWLAKRDVRRLSPGIILFFAAWLTLVQCAAWLAAMGQSGSVLEDWIFTCAVLGMLLVVLVPAVAMVLSLLALGSPQHRGRKVWVALTGAAVVAYVVATAFAFLDTVIPLATVLLAPLVPLFLLSAGFVSFVLWQWLYLARHRGDAARGDVIVLGGLLRNGRVSRLLARRVALGARMHAVAAVGTPGAALVLSGGQGSDEPRPESEAMAEYAAELGADSDSLRLESESTSTRENLRFSRALLREERAGEEGAEEQYSVATSNYHVLRTASLLRELGMSGHAYGAAASRLYLPSATLREYAAVLSDNRFLAISAVLLPLVPLAFWIIIPLIAS